MKFFVLTAVLATCVVSSLVSFKIALMLSLQWHHLMVKCLRRVAHSVPWAHRQPTSVAPALAANIVSMTPLAHLIAVMAHGMYSIGNRPQITHIVNPLHIDSNIFGCNCDDGCRRKSFEPVQPKQQSLESHESYLCVELTFCYNGMLIVFLQRGR